MKHQGSSYAQSVKLQGRAEQHGIGLRVYRFRSHPSPIQLLTPHLPCPIPRLVLNTLTVKLLADLSRHVRHITHQHLPPCPHSLPYTNPLPSSFLTPRLAPLPPHSSPLTPSLSSSLLISAVMCATSCTITSLLVATSLQYLTPLPSSLHTPRLVPLPPHSSPVQLLAYLGCHVRHITYQRRAGHVQRQRRRRLQRIAPRTTAVTPALVTGRPRPCPSHKLGGRGW